MATTLGSVVSMDRKQKEYLVKHQDTFSLQQFAKIYDTTPQEIYREYEELFESGEYYEIYKQYWEETLERLDKLEKEEDEWMLEDSTDRMRKQWERSNEQKRE